jgi:hypothetical protein
MIHNHWLSITHHDSQSLAEYSTPRFTTAGTASHTMNHNHRHSITHNELRWWCVILSKWLWIMVCYFEPLVVNHGVFCWTSGWESLWIMMSQWLWIMVCYDKTVVVNLIHNHWLSIAHNDSQPQSQHNTPWFTTTGKYHNSLWFTTIVYAEPVAVHLGVLCWASGCESWCVILGSGCVTWCVMLSQWLWIMVIYTEPVVHGSQPLANIITHYDSQPLAQNNTP